MKSSIPYAAMAALQFFTFTATAQRFKLTDGSIDALKGETFINSQFTYNDMPIGKFEHEAGYIEKKNRV